MSSFSDLALIEPLLRALAAGGYQRATPIQAAAIPPALAGRDVLGLAQTGTGKTAAFALPILQRLAGDRRRPQPRSARALVLAPTRELALQVAGDFKTYGRHLSLSLAVVHGGVGQQPQVRALARGADVLVATPGRLLDLIGQGHVRLDGVEILVLDEADRMLDLGFMPAIRRIVALLSGRRQTLLFSATMPEAIARLAAGLMVDPERIEVAPQATTVERVEQRVMFVDRADKRGLLTSLLEDRGLVRTLVFARTRHGADRVALHLRRAGVQAEAIHGSKAQGARQRVLEEFRKGTIRALVATDIAARGLDVDDISHVINFDLPNEPESYVHRIGRTARAGREGVALSFCDADEVPYLAAIEKTIRRRVAVEDDHPFHVPALARRHAIGQPAKAPPAARRGRRRTAA
jgi:ATP-dependent RNA helicase RhlE